jgi:hypothetical protein
VEEINKVNNTALAIVLIAFAVVLIGGLTVIPTATTMQSASAERSGFGGGCGVGGCGGVHNDEALGGGGGGTGDCP